MYHQQNNSYAPYSSSSPMSMSMSMSSGGIQGQLLEVTVVGCNKLKDTEWISRQDPYVCVEYGSTKFRTKTCTDGGKHPVFQEKFTYSLIEGLRELNVVVWNSNTVKYDDLIGSGKVPLQKVLSTGFDDSTWPLQSKHGRHSGEVRLIMHYGNANSQKPSKNHAPSAPPYGSSHMPQASMYSAPPPAAAPYAPHYPAASAYPASSPYPSYPPSSAPYPPSPYGAPSAYPPQPYGAPSAYPPQPYPPTPQGSPYYPPGPYPGAYPPPPY